MSEIKFSSRKAALEPKPKTSKTILPLVTTFNPASRNLKKILMKYWFLIESNTNLAQILHSAPIVAYRKDKSLKDLLVRAKIPSLD